MHVHAERWAHRPHLDGLRAIAVYLVVGFHAGVTHLSNGFVGVDVFFALSGFLVTSILLVEHRDTGTIQLRRFYLRRVLRLLPAAIVAVVGAALLMLLTQPELLRVEMVDDARASLLYVGNWHFLGESTSYFDSGTERSAYLHFWSLAIEEQFYFVFPILVFLVLRRSSWPVRRLGATVGMLMAASLTAQVWWAQRDADHAYYATEARLYQILAGALLAVVVFGRTRSVLPPIVSRGGQFLAAMATVALLVLGTDVLGLDVWVRGIVATVATVALIAALEASPRGPVGVVLSGRIPTFLGRISYGTYLWHWPIILAFRAVLDVPPGVLFALAALSATAIAAFTHELFEDPLRRSPALVSRPLPVMGVGLAISVACALVIVPGILEDARKPALAGRDVLAVGSTVAPDADVVQRALDAAVPDGLDLVAASTDPDLPAMPECLDRQVRRCVLRRGNGAHLHLLGDSNARMMIPLFLDLADEFDLTLSGSMSEGCPWQRGLDRGRRRERLVERCDLVREDAYTRVLPQLAPDIVVAILLTRGDDQWVPGSGPARDPAIEGLSSELLFDALTEESTDEILAVASSLVLVEPLPYSASSPTECLSGARVVGECAFETATDPLGTELVYQRVAEANPDRVTSVSLDRVTCPHLPVCLPVVDGDVVYRDSTHIWSEFLRARREMIWQLVTASGAIDDRTAG